LGDSIVSFTGAQKGRLRKGGLRPLTSPVEKSAGFCFEEGEWRLWSGAQADTRAGADRGESAAGVLLRFSDDDVGG